MYFCGENKFRFRKSKRMKILLIGEYSNVHHTLSLGLKELGHDVTLVSDGDGWKNYPRDIDLSRKSTGLLHTVEYLYRLHRLLPKLKGYDVVQLINPVFLELKPERILPIYQQLRKQNKSMFMDAFGMDYYWVKAGMDCKSFRYSDFNIGSKLRHTPDTEAFQQEWLNGYKGNLNRIIADDCDGIVCGLYEYYVSYMNHFDKKGKLCHIPFPIVQSNPAIDTNIPKRIKFFIGIQRTRNVYKGTDIMLGALQKLQAAYPEQTEIVKAENVPFAQYTAMLEKCDVLLDQLYSYTPAMNALQAMSQGLVLVGGGEPEYYELMKEETLRPIINVEPNEQSVFEALEQLVLHPERIPLLKQESIAFIRKHHDHLAVAQQYVDFWKERG